METITVCLRGAEWMSSLLRAGAGLFCGRCVSNPERSDGLGAYGRVGDGSMGVHMTERMLERRESPEEFVSILLREYNEFKFRTNYFQICAAVRAYSDDPLDRKKIVEAIVEWADESNIGPVVVYDMLLTDTELFEYVVAAMLNYDAMHETHYTKDFLDSKKITLYTLPSRMVQSLPPETIAFINNNGLEALIEDSASAEIS